MLFNSCVRCDSFTVRTPTENIHDRTNVVGGGLCLTVNHRVQMINDDLHKKMTQYCITTLLPLLWSITNKEKNCKIYKKKVNIGNK